MHLLFDKECLDQAVAMVANTGVSVAKCITLPTSQFDDLVSTGMMAWTGVRYLISTMPVAFDPKLAPNTFLLRSYSGTEYLFNCAEKNCVVGEPPVACWCGLGSTPCGGIHSDYCHPKLKGTYAAHR